MGWRDLVSEYGYDEDTEAILEIALHFLRVYFGHSAATAEETLTAFLQQYADDYDEDVIHHELSFRAAAAMHYLIVLKGDRQELGIWLAESGNYSAPPEAMEYFRRSFFT